MNIKVLPYIVTHIVAKTTQTMQTMQTIKQVAIIAATATLLVACAAGGGGGSSTAGPSVSAFSHNGYTFAPNIAGDTAIDTNPQPVGQVQLNNNRIRGLVAARIGVTDPQKISALSAGTDYRVSYSIDALAGSSAATFFSIDATTGAIEVSNPLGVGSGLTFDEIRAFVGNSIKVKTIITFAVPQPGSAAIAGTIESSVNVAILNAASSVDITSITTASLAYNRASVSAAGTANFNVAGAINENNNLQAPVSFGLPNNPVGLSRNPVTAFAIRSIVANSASAQATLFYDVRNPANVNQGCGASSTPNSIEGTLYIDNADLTLKASTSFNREAATNPQNNLYQCRLAVSTDGETYYPLAFVVNAAGSAVGTPINSADSSIVANLARVIQSNNLTVDSSCSNTSNNRCYYGDLAITITDVNEAPTVELVGGGSDFSGSNEGVGVLSTYISVATGAYPGPLATDGAKVDAINLRINDEDSGQPTIGEISLTVAPSHRGIGAAFSVQRPSGDNPDGYELVVNTTLLDYESFSPAQLTADGKAIYKLTITARDNNTASLASTETFNFEVVDVKYPPVFVEPTNANQPRPIASAFIKDAGIINGTAGTPLYLLPGIRAFSRGQIGTLAAVDPETGRGDSLNYRIISSTGAPAIANNLELVSANNGRSQNVQRLVVSGSGLPDGAAGSISLQVSPDASFADAATASTSVSLEVNNAAYAAASPDDPSVADISANITFITDQISFDISAAEVSEQRDTLTSVSPSLENSIDNSNNQPPTFGFASQIIVDGREVPLQENVGGPFRSILDLLGITLGGGMEKFTISPTTGEISLNANTTLDFPDIFYLPIYVNTGGAITREESDIIIISISVTDVNSPPLVSSNPVTATIAENQPVGTELARFTITDDNQAYAKSASSISFTDASIADLLEIRSTTNRDGSIAASIHSRVLFDYENPTHRAALDTPIALSITDAGRYTQFGSMSSVITIAPVPTAADDNQTTSLNLNIEFTNIIENPVLAAGNGTSYSVSESAGQGIAVAASGNQVVAMLGNALDFPTDAGTGYNASRINFSVSGRFADILEVAPADNPDGNGVLALGLTVADASALENLGDGLTFPVTIVATADSNPRLSALISIDVTITNDPANSNIKQAVIDTAIAQLGRIRINEQDVVGRSTYPIPAANFSISLTDLAADADEFFQFNGRPTTRRLVVPELALEAVAFATSTNLNPNEFVATANILNLELGRDNIYRLTIADTNFVEKALFGDINFNLVASARGTSSSTDTSASIAVTPAAPKNVVYAAAATTTPATPPVYALSYAQTPYDNGQLVANTSGISVGVIDATTAFSTALRGVTADAIDINGTTEVYKTLALDGASGRFIARDYATAAGLITSNDNLGNIQLNTDNKLVINFATATNDLLDFPRGFDILKPDATGGLVDARAEFNAYFDLAVNNTASPKYISISQKVFSQADNVTRKYNALDTIQLYRGATETYTLNYFIRARAATDGTATASNYALAQFSVAVAAAGIRVVPDITGFADNNPDLEPASFNYDSTPVSVSWIIRDTSADANTITQTLVSSDTSVCSVANPTPTFVSPTAAVETFTSAVDALSPGTCTLTINATEDGASNAATINIVFPNLPPTVTTASLTNSGNVVDLGSGFAASGYRANAVDGSFVVTINAENVDPGDDDPRDPDVTFAQAGGDSCTIAESITTANYVTSIATTVYTITNPTGGACGAITISVNEEDTQGANQDIAGTFNIPADTFIFDSAPRLSRPDPEPVFAGYAAPTTFEVTVANNDAGAAAGTVTIAATSTGSCTATASAIANGVATITVTPTATGGECSVAVTATEDGLDSNVETFSFTLIEIAPLISVAGQTSPYTLPIILAGENTTITLTATKQDISNAGVGFAVASNPGGCTIAGFSGTTSYTESDFSVPLTDTAKATRDITISLPADRFGQGGTCTIDFTAREDGQISAPFRVIASFNPIEQPPLIAIISGVARVNIPAIPGTTHEITVTATKQDTTDIDEVMFTTSFATVANTQHCDVGITNPTASYVGGGVGGIGGIATTNITISYSGPPSMLTQCRVNVAVTEGTKTSNLPFITGFSSAIYVQFLSVNAKPLLELSGVPTGTPFPDDQLRIGVQARKQDDISGGEVSSEVRVVNGACEVILDGEDTSYITQHARFGDLSSPTAYYNITLDAANAVSTIAAERECELEFSVTETETLHPSATATNDPIGTNKTTNRTVTFTFAQELPPLFVSISNPSGNTVTSPSNREARVDITLEKQDASNTRDLTLPATINSTGNICTATLRDPARYAATSINSRATGTYAVRINNVAISEHTACGEFVFTATEGSATASSDMVTGITIVFTPPPVSRPPRVAVSYGDDVTNIEVAIVNNAIAAVSRFIGMTAIKNDSDDTTTVNIPDTITSTGGDVVCTAIADTDNAGTKNYNRQNNLVTYAALYTVANPRPNSIPNVNCGSFVFFATEDGQRGNATVNVTFLGHGVPGLDVDLPLGNKYPDDPAFTYTIIVFGSGDNIPNPVFVTEATTSAGCSLMGTGAPMTTTSNEGFILRGVKVKYTGNNPTNPGSCLLSFNATEDGLAAPTKMINLTFNPEATPTVTSITQSGNLAPTVNQSTQINILVTKGDGGANASISFPASVASGTCLASLRGPSSRSFTGTPAIATVPVIYDVTTTEAGSCGNFTFAGIKAGSAPAVTENITSNEIIFTRGILPPSIDVQVIGNARNVPIDQTVNVSVTATKQGDSNILDVTFLGMVISSAGCRATLAGNEIRQYNGILAGISSVTVTYMVTSAIAGGACGNFVFTATESSLTATHTLSNDISFSFSVTDYDGDGIINSLDVDEDGDGLIEIATADELNQLRDDLAGSSLAGNSSGCGGNFYANGSRIQECNGYELVADIDLAATGYNNWDPIGKKASAFTGIFEGNNHIIDNLNMQLYAGFGWGLFGYIDGATIRNAHVRNVNITFSGDNSGVVDHVGFTVPARVGGLVGSAETSMIINSSVTGRLVAGAWNVGGLVGYAEGGGIISSYVELEEVNATSVNVGGLVGTAQIVTIRLSYALTDKVTVVREYGGGLVGESGASSIESSMAIMTNITTQNLGLGVYGISTYGGLLGLGLASKISFTAGITGNMLGNVSRSGGLLGLVQRSFSTESTIDASYAITQFQTVLPAHILPLGEPRSSENSGYGGLIGVDKDPGITRNSYWDNTTLTPLDTSNRDASQYGVGKSTTALQGTTDFSGSDNIFAAWANGWCDAATNEFTTDPSSPLATIPNADANRFWDLGAADEYPAMNCLPNNFTPAKQRAAMAKALNGESPLID